MDLCKLMEASKVTFQKAGTGKIAITLMEVWRYPTPKKYNNQAFKRRLVFSNNQFEESVRSLIELCERFCTTQVQVEAQVRTKISSGRKVELTPFFFLDNESEILEEGHFQILRLPIKEINVKNQ